MKFARTVYRIAAIYGILVLLPLYFVIADDELHPDFAYGFVGLALVWQLAFLLIASDPIRYRPLMLVTLAEKVVYTIPAVILFCLGRVGTVTLAPALVDPILGIFFFAAYRRTANAKS
jgi:hypothetical protein